MYFLTLYEWQFPVSPEVCTVQDHGVHSYHVFVFVPAMVTVVDLEIFLT